MQDSKAAHIRLSMRAASFLYSPLMADGSASAGGLVTHLTLGHPSRS